MTFIFLVVKLYIIILLFRFVITGAELNFNPVAKAVGSVTSPVLNLFKVSREKTRRFIPIFIVILIILASLLNIAGKPDPIHGFFAAIANFLRFFMLFFIISVILGSLVNKPMMSSYVTYFFRLGLPWVKLTRSFIPISSGKIVYPTIITIFFIYICASFLTLIMGGILSGGPGFGNPWAALALSLKSGLLGLTDILFYASWLMIARALLSWVSPDIRNPIVQLIYVLTEPILAPFRRIIPPIGIIDLSALAAIIVLSVVASILQRVIVSIF